MRCHFIKTSVESGTLQLKTFWEPNSQRNSDKCQQTIYWNLASKTLHKCGKDSESNTHSIQQTRRLVGTKVYIGIFRFQSAMLKIEKSCLGPWLAFTARNQREFTEVAASEIRPVKQHPQPRMTLIIWSFERENRTAYHRGALKWQRKVARGWGRNDETLYRIQQSGRSVFRSCIPHTDLSPLHPFLLYLTTNVNWAGQGLER